MLVPFSTYIGVTREQPSQNCISFGVVHTDATGVEYSAFASMRDLMPTKKEPIEGAVARKEAVEFIVPYFCVRKVSDPTDATFVEAVHEIKESVVAVKADVVRRTCRRVARSHQHGRLRATACLGVHVGSGPPRSACDITAKASFSRGSTHWPWACLP